MSTAEPNKFELGNTAGRPHTFADWTPRDAAETTYHCDVGLIPEEDGTFSAIVLNLPGVGSCGATRDEALRNVREAILGAIESYAAHHEEIPWRESVLDDLPKDAERKWILVNV